MSLVRSRAKEVESQGKVPAKGPGHCASRVGYAAVRGLCCLRQYGLGGKAPVSCGAFGEKTTNGRHER